MPPSPSQCERHGWKNLSTAPKCASKEEERGQLSGKTDQKGRYVFKDLAHGIYKVSVFVNQAPSSLDNVNALRVPMRVEFNLKAIAAGKKPRLWAYGKEQGGSYGGRWFELDASGRFTRSGSNR